MLDVIKEFSDKLDIKKYLFIYQDVDKLYKDVQKMRSNIPPDNLKGKLVEVLNETSLNNEQLIQISSNGNKLGWIIVENPLYIYYTFPEKVVVLNQSKDNVVNELLSLYDTVEENKIYTKKYFLEFKNEVFFGLVNDDFLITFLKANQISNGDIELIGFKFNTKQTEIYQDLYLKTEVSFINNEKTYFCDKVLTIQNTNIGSFKIAKTRYWFKLEDTNIEENDVVYIANNSTDYLKIEHLFYSNNKSNQKKVGIIEEEIVKRRFAEYNEKIKILNKENNILKERLQILAENKQNTSEITPEK